MMMITDATLETLAKTGWAAAAPQRSDQSKVPQVEEKSAARVLAMSSTSDHGKALRSYSAIVADRPSGSHDLKIDYSLLAGTSIPTGDHLLSFPFTVGGHRWRIMTYPNGITPEAAGYVSLYLYRDDDDEDVAKPPVTAQMQLSIMVEKQRAIFFLKRKEVVIHTNKKAVTSFASQGSMGYPKFVKRETMLKHGARRGKAAGGDPFTIRCAIVVHNGSRAVAVEEKLSRAAASIVPVPPSNLSAHLGELLSSKMGADVVFEVGGETFAAHRAVLAARSPVFAVEFFSAAMRESDGSAGVVRVDDMEPQVFQALLRFAYTDSLPETTTKREESAMCEHLLVAADRYDIERLKLMCEDRLCRHIDVRTAAIILTLAEQHSCTWLKKACLDFVSDPANLKAVVASDGFEHLSTSCPSIRRDLIAMLAS